MNVLPKEARALRTLGISFKAVCVSYSSIFEDLSYEDCIVRATEPLYSNWTYVLGTCGWTVLKIFYYEAHP